MSLEREVETYRRRLPELLSNEGKFVVIYGDDIVGIRDTLENALDLGYDRFGNEAFLAREITKKEKILYTTRVLRSCPLSAATKTS